MKSDPGNKADLGCRGCIFEEMNFSCNFGEFSCKNGGFSFNFERFSCKNHCLVVIVKYWELLKEDSKTELSFGDSQNKQFFLIGKVIVCRVNNCVFYRNLFHSFRYTITIRENMIPKV